MACSLEHFRDPGFCRENDGKPVGPLFFEEEARQLVRCIRIHQTRRWLLDKSFLRVFIVERIRNGSDDFLKNGFARHGIIALQIFSARSLPASR